MPPATVTDLGLTRKAIHEARQIRNAEAVSPGIVRQVLDERLMQEQDPATLSLKKIRLLQTSRDAGSKT